MRAAAGYYGVVPAEIDDLDGISLRAEYDFSNDKGRVLVGIRCSNSLLVADTATVGGHGLSRCGAERR